VLPSQIANPANHDVPVPRILEIIVRGEWLRPPPASE